MYNNEYTTTPKEEPSSSGSNPISHDMDTTPNDPSACGPGTASRVQLQPNNGSHHFDFPEHLLAPLIQGALQHPLTQAQRNSGNPNNSTTFCPGGSGVPTAMAYGGQPMALPNVPVGLAAGNAGPSFQIADQPPTWAWDEVRPNICARPDEQGIPGPLWQLVNVGVEQPSGDDLYVIIHYKKTRPL